MVQEYNFDRVGKKMPFVMPEGFFVQMQANVLAEVEKEETAKLHRQAIIRRIFVMAASMAACVCLVVGIGYGMMNEQSQEHSAAGVATASVASVDKAYDNLSTEEQQDLNATYANDIYLSME